MPSLPGRDLLLAATLAVVLGGSFAVVIIFLWARAAERRRREERRLTSLGASVAKVLHQVKNPLQSILLHAELLQEPLIAEDAKARGEASRAIAEEAERLAAILAELSNYAAGEGRVLRREPVPLHDLVRDIARCEARDSGLPVECEAVEECTVSADAFHLRQALENLVANAREAMRGQEDARLTVRLDRREGSAVVAVIDTGPGVPAKAAESIFQPFVSGKSGGMGLGLAIAREIVGEHGGRIEVRSAEGRGSHFRVILPLDGAEAAG